MGKSFSFISRKTFPIINKRKKDLLLVSRQFA